MSHPAEYKHIRAWGRLLDSDASYIRAEQERAAADGAPLDAVYSKTGWDFEGKPLARRWVCYRTVTHIDTRTLMDRFLKERD